MKFIIVILVFIVVAMFAAIVDDLREQHKRASHPSREFWRRVS